MSRHSACFSNSNYTNFLFNGRIIGARDEQFGNRIIKIRYQSGKISDYKVLKQPELYSNSQYEPLSNFSTVIPDNGRSI
ncbi:MAG: hypothetical protein JW915_18135 [Chitinispirillaceae bacterium]|nr:hypothetical protein [Chitinispirillaceae bacterium]